MIDVRVLSTQQFQLCFRHLLRVLRVVGNLVRGRRRLTHSIAGCAHQVQYWGIGFPIFIDDIHANAQGYLLLYKSEEAAHGSK